MNTDFEYNHKQDIRNHAIKNYPGLLLITQVFLLSILMSSCSQKSYTIYLVRHAEKAVSEENPRDPELTPCGHDRAKSLSRYLDEVNIDMIYSSDYVRTRSTAKPTADSKNKQIELYNPRDLESLVTKLHNNANDALVVGHSNSTVALVGLLLGSEDKLESMDESVYDRIYHFSVRAGSKELILFHSAFRCED